MTQATVGAAIVVLAPVVTALFSALVAAGLGATMKRLAGSHGSDIRLIWYFFFLAVTGTTLVIWWGVSAGAISDGKFSDGTGQTLQGLFVVLTDPPHEALFLAMFVTVVLLPQYAGYVISALFGCAGEPLFVKATWHFVFWSAVKFMVVAAGVQIARGTMGFLLHWTGFELDALVVTALVALSFVGLSFSAILVYREGFEVIATLSLWTRLVLGPLRARLLRWARRFDTWGKRHIPKDEPNEWIEAVGFKKLHLRNWTLRSGRNGWSIEARRKRKLKK